MKMRGYLIVALAMATAACAGRVSNPGGEIEPVETPRELGIDDFAVESVNAATGQIDDVRDPGGVQSVGVRLGCATFTA